MTLAITISTGSSTPIYKQIADQVRLAVATGKFRVGEQLPSVRVLAEELVLNPNTVAHAYADLARDGFIETRPGRGVFVIRKRRILSREEARRRLEPVIDALVGQAAAMDFTREELEELFDRKLRQWEASRRTS